MKKTKTGFSADVARRWQASQEAHERAEQAELRRLEQLGQVLEPRGWVRSRRSRPGGLPFAADSFEWPPSRSDESVDPSAISILGSDVEVFLADAPHAMSAYRRVFSTIDALDEHVLTRIEAYRCPPTPPGLPGGFTPTTIRPRTLEDILSSPSPRASGGGTTAHLDLHRPAPSV